MKFNAEKLSSKQNPRIKNLLQLQKHSERLKQNIFVVEGIKEIEKAVLAGYEIDSLFYCPEIITTDIVTRTIQAKYPKEAFEISRELFNKIAYRKDSGGMVMLTKPKPHQFEFCQLPSNPLILVIEGVEKPGNIGAIYRTADAAGVSAIFICEPGTDIYNPNVIRASLGCIFTVPTVICSSKEAIQYLKDHDIKIYTSYLEASQPYHLLDYSVPSAIVMGTEASGVSSLWVNTSDATMIIPMKGIADSMNVSTAAAVLVFEACRQRDFDGSFHRLPL